MKRKIIIHGGYQRCATTFLQEEIFINLKDYLCLSKPQQSFSAGKRKFYFEEKKELSLDESIKNYTICKMRLFQENTRCYQ